MDCLNFIQKPMLFKLAVGQASPFCSSFPLSKQFKVICLKITVWPLSYKARIGFRCQKLCWIRSTIMYERIKSQVSEQVISSTQRNGQTKVNVLNVEVPFLDEISVSDIIKLVALDTYDTLTVKVIFDRYKMFLEVTNNSTIMFLEVTSDST